MTLYNAHTHEHDTLTVTKFDRLGNPEASYETSTEACTCPAGHRHTCRHRTMLPNLLPIADTQWFWDYDLGITIDLNGIPKQHYDSLVPKGQHGIAIEPALDAKGPEEGALCVDEGCPQAGTDHVCIERSIEPANVRCTIEYMTDGSVNEYTTVDLPTKSWRRL